MDAYMIETLRHHNLSDDELLTRLEKKDITFSEEIKFDFDVNELLKLYEQNPITFKSILLDGYTIKFVTLNGLKNLLKIKFDKVDERDYKLLDNRISHLTIEENAYPVLKQMLSQNWKIQNLTEENSSQSTRTISILPA